MSVKCPGMSIVSHAYQACENGKKLILKGIAPAYSIPEWKFNPGDGTIESKLCPGKVISLYTDIMLNDGRVGDNVALWTSNGGNWNEVWEINIPV